MATTRIRMEIPAEPDQKVVKALRLAAESLGVKIKDIEGTADAPPNSYSLTIHTYPDAGEG